MSFKIIKSIKQIFDVPMALHRVIVASQNGMKTQERVFHRDSDIHPKIEQRGVWNVELNLPLEILSGIAYTICMTKQIEPMGEKSWTHRADNRERLIAAGYSILSQHGYVATTVKEVAHVAGVSPGLFHYYFASKDDLLIAILHEAGRRYGQLMQALRAAVPTDRFLEAAIDALRQRVAQEPGWYRLRYELFALGLRQPTFLPVVGEMLGTLRHLFTQAFLVVTEGDEARAQALAALAIAAFDGLALQQLVQPEADLAGAYALLRTVILAGNPPPP